jgi:uncharacterized SAM-binding protein YcdF (DUF218 family)
MSPYDRTVFRRAVAIGAAAAVVILVVVAISGHWLFADAPEDELQRADAVVVLGGEHDGREQHGIDVARQVGASTVVLSDPYPANDRVMSKLCGTRPFGIEIVCRAPEPPTTRGEAVMTRELAGERGWDRIVVVSWRYHLLRSRMIFSSCYSSEPGKFIMRAVPRTDDFPFALWEYVYLYQYVALMKVMVQGACK